MTTATSDGVSPETKGQIQEFVKEFCYFLECLHVASVKPNGVAQATPLNLLIPADAAASLFMSIRKDFRGRECQAARYPSQGKGTSGTKDPSSPTRNEEIQKPAPRKARADKMMQEAEKAVKAPPEVKKELEKQGGRDPADDREGADYDQGSEFMKDGGPSEKVDDAKEKLRQDLAKGLLRCVRDPHTGRVSQVPGDIFSLAREMGLIAKTENGWCVTFPVDA